MRNRLWLQDLRPLGILAQGANGPCCPPFLLPSLPAPWHCLTRCPRRGRARQSPREKALTEIHHGRGIVAGTVVGNEVDLPLPLLLLEAQFGPAVPVGAAAAEEDQDSPQEPEPCQGRGEKEEGQLWRKQAALALLS